MSYVSKPRFVYLMEGARAYERMRWDKMMIRCDAVQRTKRFSDRANVLCSMHALHSRPDIQHDFFFRT